MISYSSICYMTSKVRVYNGKDLNLTHSYSYFKKKIIHAFFFFFWGGGGSGNYNSSQLLNKQNQKQEAECNCVDKSQVSSFFVES